MNSLTTPSAEATGPAAAKPKLLLVDDYPALFEQFKNLLADEYHIETAISGTQALESARQQRPDLIVADIIMPGLDGIELLKALRRDVRTQAIPVILLSGQAPEQVEVEAYETGADGYLSKPFTLREFRARVRATLDGARLRAALARNEAISHAEALRVRERAAILESITDAFYALDPQWRYTYINQRALDFYGRSRDELLGKVIWDVFPLSQGSVFQREFARAVAEQRSVAFETFSRQLNRWVDVHAYPMPDGLAVSFQDISARKQAEEQLKLHAHVLESMNEGVTVTDENGYIVYTNPAEDRMFGYQRGELIGQNVSVLNAYPPGQNEQVMSDVLTQLKEGKIWTGEWHNRRKDGGTFHTQAHIAPLERGGKKFWVAVQRDITEIKQAAVDRERAFEQERHAREEAERLGTLKDEFLTTLSHELRTPLNAILGWSHLLQVQGESDPDYRKGLESIERNARAQSHIISDLLDMSRIITGKIQIEVRPVNLSEVVLAAIDAIKPAAQAKGVRVQSTLDTRIGTVRGDGNRLQQVFWNLLSNAVKFTPNGGRVHVVLERVNSHVEVSVDDTGIGIDYSFLPYVFDRFRQADSSSTRRSGGLGLGLSIVKHLVEMHGGSVRAKSAGPGLGASFIVALPMTSIHGADESDPLTAAPSQTGLDLPWLKGVRILVVDDEPDALALISRILSERGAEVRLVSSAVEALGLLDQHPFDVLISDIGMPDMDGYMLLREIRRRPRERGGALPAIALTAFARPDDRLRALLSGYQQHVPKPVEPTDLLASVGAVIELTRLAAAAE